MPYGVFQTGPDDEPYCVHRKDSDGEPIGKALGCHPTRDAAEDQIAAIWASENKTVIHPGVTGKVVAGKTPQVLEVLGVPFGGPMGGKDVDGEFFSERTELALKPGDRRPVFYNHGEDPANTKVMFPEVIGEATYIGKRADGHWFEVVIDDTNEFAKRVVEAAKQGMARASSGAIGYLTRILRRTGEILVWPLGELSLLDADPGGRRIPSNDYAVAHLKTAFAHRGIEFPEAFAEAPDGVKANATKDEYPCKERVSIDPFYIVEARRLMRPK